MDEPDSARAAGAAPVPFWRTRPLRFADPLEREFLRHRTRATLPLVRFSIVLAQILFAALLLYDAVTVRQLQHLYIYALVFGGGGGAAVLPLALSFFKPSGATYRRVGYAAVAINAAALVAVQLISQVRSVPWPYEVLLIHLLYDFYFSGLVLRSATPLALATWLAYGAGSTFTGLEPGVLWHRLFFMGAVIVLGAVTSFIGERVERVAWLRGRQLDRLAHRDGLTGLANRHLLNQRAPQLLRQAARDRKPVGLLLIDLDHFKTLNDCRGHLVGDGALRTVAGVIGRRARRGFDLAVRWGGEEFLLLLYDCAPQGLASIAEGLRAELAALDIGNPDAPGGRLTASIGGVCCVPARDGAQQQLIAGADTALYRAKSEGRNRVVLGDVPYSSTIQQSADRLSHGEETRSGL
ncbi:MAG: GGDEF domain-containing protein [Gammaproteobacteria bacterium]|nr:GGDEF domain-containing protein [Gammaproteobacteria bacterium]